MIQSLFVMANCLYRKTKNSKYQWIYKFAVKKLLQTTLITRKPDADEIFAIVAHASRWVMSRGHASTNQYIFRQWNNFIHHGHRARAHVPYLVLEFKRRSYYQQRSKWNFALPWFFGPSQVTTMKDFQRPQIFFLLLLFKHILLAKFP